MNKQQSAGSVHVQQTQSTTLLAALGEKPSSAIDNLDRAERLGLLKSVDEWITMRNLRNQMVHESSYPRRWFGYNFVADHIEHFMGVTF